MKRYLVIVLLLSVIIAGCVSPPKSPANVKNQLPTENTTFDSNRTVDKIDPGMIKTLPVDQVSDKVISVQETEKVNLQVKVEDPDNDNVTITYDDPLDASGQWQTTYGRAGNYPITITVTDGVSSTSQKILLVVNKKEQPPTIEEFEPANTQVQSIENQESTFAVIAKDVNLDVLSYTWLLDGDEVGFEQSYDYTPSFESAGSHSLLVQVSDGVKSVSNQWDIDVQNVNRAPVLADLPDRTILENELFDLKVDVSDPDNDELDIQVSEPLERGGWQPSFNDAGVYTVTVTVTDGDLSASKSFKLTVENVNRPPVIIDIIQQ